MQDFSSKDWICMYFLDHNQVTWSRRNSLSLPLSLSETFCKSDGDKTLPDHRHSLLLIWPEYIHMFWAGVWRKATELFSLSNFWIIVVLVTDEHVFYRSKLIRIFLWNSFEMMENLKTGRVQFGKKHSIVETLPAYQDVIVKSSAWAPFVK